jgi:hypothetical protein
MIDKSTKNFSKARLCPGRDSNRTPSNKCGAVTATPTRCLGVYAVYCWLTLARETTSWRPHHALLTNTSRKQFPDRLLAGLDVYGSWVDWQVLTPISLGDLVGATEQYHENIRGRSEPCIWHRLYLWRQRSWVYQLGPLAVIQIKKSGVPRIVDYF